ncbi:MAG: XRE family transcriptional regulator [Porticoccaceae bacterium]|jgi:predicted XRE-type DNA-binding protein|nr:XRE family transcriptional regulator [Porticoccaceae bacterium]
MTKLAYENIFDAITEDANEAADLKFRSDLLIVIRGIFEARGWKQADIVQALDISQPRASELTRGLVDKYSSDKLISFLAKLGYRFSPGFSISKKSDIKIFCEVTPA